MKRIAGMAALLLLVGLPAQAQPPRTIVAEVRAAIAKGDFALGERLVAADRAAHGVTPSLLEALSWLGRGALAAKQWDKAEAYARQTYDLAVKELAHRKVDDEPHLPIALGAAIEVLAHVGVGRGARTDAVAFLRGELDTFANTSLHKRIQKNLNLLTLEGAVAPALDLSEHIGPPLPGLDAFKGKVVLLFFWAHWCPDCKAQAPVLGRLGARYGKQGFTVIAPTQRYGYVAGGKAASAPEETRYIEQILHASYSALPVQSVPLSEVNHQRYGVSTTPTLVLIDRKGRIRLYHPGQMTEEALEPLVHQLVNDRSQGTIGQIER